MGCTYSGQSSRNEGAVRSFRVHNVDDQGVKLSRGNIEIRDNDLLLYQKGKEPIRWPLHCLRRYGFDAELFSFESGRRSATGAGIYAFKCAHAEALFNLVQESIQRAGEEAQRGQQPQPQPHVNHTVAAPPGNQPLMDWGVPVPGGPPHHHESFSHFVPPPGADDSPDMQHAGREGSSHLYVNGVVNRDNPQHEYLNAGPQVGAIGAFQIDETAALIEFLHHPPGFGGGNGRSQVNYAELYMPEAPASVENLVEEAMDRKDDG
ncbi:fibroblast growth factor receptor substrate 3 [Aplysia californica]|uniref:Fibroblast growth factor receptor substrate 3 n=1 Tax=Aplysia californica TaxID=6500 RepID=A0ABM1A598_APLCA|nr:fibroblast growth factor receptor substrate 3 [Aplysia californica]